MLWMMGELKTATKLMEMIDDAVFQGIHENWSGMQANWVGLVPQGVESQCVCSSIYQGSPAC